MVVGFTTGVGLSECSSRAACRARGAGGDSPCCLAQVSTSDCSFVPVSMSRSSQIRRKSNLSRILWTATFNLSFCRMNAWSLFLYKSDARDFLASSKNARKSVSSDLERSGRMSHCCRAFPLPEALLGNPSRSRSMLPPATASRDRRSQISRAISGNSRNCHVFQSPESASSTCGRPLTTNSLIYSKSVSTAKGRPLFHE